MSVKDLIWVNVAQGLKRKEEREVREQEVKFKFEQLETAHLTVCDLRDLLLDTNLYVKAHALKGAKGAVKPFNIKNLTSSRVAKKRKEDEKRAKMTPEEQAEYDVQRFLAGEIIE